MSTFKDMLNGDMVEGQIHKSADSDMATAEIDLIYPGDDEISHKGFIQVHGANMEEAARMRDRIMGCLHGYGRF